MVGVGQGTLSGAHPLKPWGQDPEVLSRFPSECRRRNSRGDTRGVHGEGGGGARREGGGGGGSRGDSVFVEGLEDFCFPSGAGISLVRASSVSGIGPGLA